MTKALPRNGYISYDGEMAKSLSPEEALERARKLQDERLNTVRAVAEARQTLTDVKEATDRELAELQARIAERVAEAERDDVRAYNAALAAGWSADELRRIGLSEPVKKARVRKRASGSPRPPKQSEQGSSEPPADTAQHSE